MPTLFMAERRFEQRAPSHHIRVAFMATVGEALPAILWGEWQAGAILFSLSTLAKHMEPNMGAEVWVQIYLYISLSDVGLEQPLSPKSAGTRLVGSL